jgi:hypothetical protein
MTSEPSGILVPAYVYPSDGAWDVLLDVGRTMMLGGLIVIANPDDGPGYNEETKTYVNTDANYVSSIAALQSICTPVIGYVHDCYANTNPPGASNCPRTTNILADIGRWFNAYGVDGIFIDQVSDTDVSRAASLVAAVRSLRSDAIVVLNPGSIPSSEFMEATGPAIVVIQEQEFAKYGDPWPPEQWVKDREMGNITIAAHRLAIIAHTPTSPTDVDLLVDVASRYVIGWVHGQHTAGSLYNELSTQLPSIARRRNRCSCLGLGCIGDVFCRIVMSILCFMSRMSRRARTLRRR